MDCAPILPANCVRHRLLATSASSYMHDGKSCGLSRDNLFVCVQVATFDARTDFPRVFSQPTISLHPLFINLWPSQRLAFIVSTHPPTPPTTNRRHSFFSFSLSHTLSHAFTSTMTSVLPRRTTRSISPSRERTLRATIAYPRSR